MDDWIRDIVGEIKQADKERLENELKMKYVVRKRETQAIKGSDLWGQLLNCCQSLAAELNQQIYLEFGSDQSKRVKIVTLDPTTMALSGTCPEFSMNVFYDSQRSIVSLSGERKSHSGREGRNGYLYMELDGDGNPCFSVVDGQHPVATNIAARYIFDLAIASSQDHALNKCLSQAQRT